MAADYKNCSADQTRTTEESAIRLIHPAPGAAAAQVAVAAGLMSLLCSLTLNAYELHEVRVVHQDKQYSVEMRVTLEAAVADSYATFTDFSSLPKIHSAIKQAHVSLAGDGSTLLSTLLRVCISFYCRELNQLQTMKFAPISEGSGTVQADVIAEKSDFRYGKASWIFSDQQGQTLLHFSATMEPDFWVPPLIGPWLIQRRLRSEAIETSANLEKLALQRSSTPKIK